MWMFSELGSNLPDHLDFCVKNTTVNEWRSQSQSEPDGKVRMKQRLTDHLCWKQRLEEQGVGRVKR